jgi:rare lipoprotein A (peptidoglycan hydrolase)
MLGNVVRFHGTLAGSRPGDAVAIQRLDRRAGWITAVATSIGPDGTFDAAWRSDHAGRTTIRVVPDGQAPTASAAAASPPTRDMTVFRPAKVTWYGPGFWGRHTACGQRLTRTLLGVAHRSLPCGTLVELYKDGRTVTVPVVDRGPFRAGASYDLTQAAASALGVTATSTVGAVRADGSPAAPQPATAGS